MPKNPPRDNRRNRTLRTVQNSGSILQRVMQRPGLQISLENQITETLLAGLPEALRGHVIQVVDKGEELVILMDAAAWAARLKLALAESPDLTSGRRATVKVVPRGATGR